MDLDELSISPVAVLLEQAPEKFDRLWMQRQLDALRSELEELRRVATVNAEVAADHESRIGALEP